MQRGIRGREYDLVPISIPDLEHVHPRCVLDLADLDSSSAHALAMREQVADPEVQPLTPNTSARGVTTRQMESELLASCGHLRVARRVRLLPCDDRSLMIEVIEEQKLEAKTVAVEVRAPPDVFNIQNRLDLASELRLCALHETSPAAQRLRDERPGNSSIGSNLAASPVRSIPLLGGNEMFLKSAKSTYSAVEPGHTSYSGPSNLKNDFVILLGTGL
jgi:hypothetical protein